MLFSLITWWNKVENKYRLFSRDRKAPIVSKTRKWLPELSGGFPAWFRIWYWPVRAGLDVRHVVLQFRGHPRRLLLRDGRKRFHFAHIVTACHTGGKKKREQAFYSKYQRAESSSASGLDWLIGSVDVVIWWLRDTWDSYVHFQEYASYVGEKKRSYCSLIAL